jgi:uncharacterized damage-inducible protein DinB
MKEHFLKLLTYNGWANRCFMQLLEDSPVINNKIFLLFSHVLTAEEVWLCRARSTEPPLQRLWQEYPNTVLKKMLEDNAHQWQAHVAGLKEKALLQPIAYQNSKGESFRTPLCDIITHLVNHGTHHRGQIAGLLQQEKVQPPVSDYIHYLRQPLDKST